MTFLKLWQPYVLCEWDHLKSADPNLLDRIFEQRKVWQEAGYISKRKYPAFIIFTLSGARHPTAQFDWLEARVFSDIHPDGSPIEIYILTSYAGSVEIERRVNADFPHLAARLENMLISIPPSIQDDKGEFLKECTPKICSVLNAENRSLASSLDIGSIPKLLLSKLDMRIVNHDGGADVLRMFCNAGAICQMNLTLCRNKSLHQVLKDHPMVSTSVKDEALSQFNSRVKYFFPPEKEDQSGSTYYPVPSHLRPVAVLSDDFDDVAIVTFDTRGGKVFL